MAYLNLTVDIRFTVDVWTICYIILGCFVIIEIGFKSFGCRYIAFGRKRRGIGIGLRFSYGNGFDYFDIDIDINISYQLFMEK